MLRLNLSNNQIVFILIIAIMISTISTLTIYQVGVYEITGRQSTDIATSNLTIASEVGCSFDDFEVDFGTVKIGSNNDSDEIEDWWALNNTGSENLTINFSLGNGDWLFLGSGCAGGNCQAATINWRAAVNTTLSGVIVIDETTWYNIGSTTQHMLNGLEPDPAYRVVSFSNNITVPSGEATGEKGGQVEADCRIVP